MSNQVVGRSSLVVGRHQPWRRLPTFTGLAAEFLPGAEAMLAGLEASGRPALRWYVASRPALILGSSQKITEVDEAASRAAGVSVHRRRSGGTAVYTDATALSLDVALPTGHRLYSDNVTKTYRWFGDVWAEALQSLGIDAWVMPPVEARPFNAALDPLAQRACYGGVSPYEVFVGERKIVGLAQVRRRQGAVLQAGVYTHWEPERLVTLLNAPPAERGAIRQVLASRAVGLHDTGTSFPTHADVITAWEAAVTTMQSVTLIDDEWTDEERAAADAAHERYADLSNGAREK